MSEIIKNFMFFTGFFVVVYVLVTSMTFVEYIVLHEELSVFLPFTHFLLVVISYWEVYRWGLEAKEGDDKNG